MKLTVSVHLFCFIFAKTLNKNYQRSSNPPASTFGYPLSGQNSKTHCAQERTRTSKELLPQASEACVSTNFTTWAFFPKTGFVPRRGHSNLTGSVPRLARLCAQTLQARLNRASSPLSEALPALPLGTTRKLVGAEERTRTSMGYPACS